MDKSNIDRICVQVFAKISASVSHEIKNTLSIINENAGLLEDFAQMAEEDGVAAQRVFSATTTIAKQVDRSNTIMKNLNRFAHSADSCMAQGNLQETLSLVVALTNRQAAMKNITMTLECPQDLTFSTHLIAFESLIYLTFLALFKHCTEKSILTVEVKNETPNITLCFGSKNEDDMSCVPLPDDDQKLLADRLHADFRYEKNAIFLTFPMSMS